MGLKSQIAIYWGEDSFCIVETDKKRILHSQYIPFDTPLETPESQDVPEGLKLTALIQKFIKDNGITSKKINLSLPSQDLIFRSFIIPFMQPEEIRSVVDFEATKYIPIPLDDLAYAYHPVPFTEGGQKNIRILFVAIRKDILERYTGILHHTGLQVDHIEPSPISINRLLIKKGVISHQHSYAIIFLGETNNEIIIVDKGIVQFVRRFQIPQNQKADASFLSAQLFNDIRVSFNFYSRQSPNSTIEKILTLSTTDYPHLAKDLNEEFSIPTASFLAAEILKTDKVDNLGLLNAQGASLAEKAFSSKDFDLSDKAIKVRREGLSASASARIKNTAGIVGICGFIIAVTIFLSNQLVVSKKNRLAELNAKQSSLFKSSDTAAIEKLKNQKLDKLNQYKDIRRESHIAEFLNIVPKLLPKGVWLSSFNIQYVDETIREKKQIRQIQKPQMTLDGFVYHKNANEQFRIVTSLVSRLREDDTISKYFNVIERTATGQTTIDEYKVTTFSVICKRENEK